MVLRQAVTIASGRTTFKVAITSSLVMVVLMVGAPNLAAQSPAELGELPDVSGTWRIVSRSKPPACAPGFVIEEDERQLPRYGCRLDWSDHINARTRAWFRFHDEPVEGKFYCVPESIPSTLARVQPVRITRRGDRVVIESEGSMAYNVIRTVWTDGRPHPPPGDVAYYGHSIGRYEGDALIVETQNFTFDPNGMDYQGQVPSSWAKRLTERYSLVGPDHLRMELTVEDPVFLTRPYTETFEYERTDQEVRRINDCDPVAAAAPLGMLPPKYRDD